VQRIQTMLQAQLQLIAGRVPLGYLALDGHFGNSPTLQMVRGCGLQLISKLRADAALYFRMMVPTKGGALVGSMVLNSMSTLFPNSSCASGPWRTGSKPVCIKPSCCTKSFPSR
jgi:hypothetical protein